MPTTNTLPPEVEAALDLLLLHRSRRVMLIGAAAAVAFIAITHLLGWAQPWSDAMNVAIGLLLLISLGLARLPTVQRHMIALCLLLGAALSVVRALAGIQHNDVTATAIFLVVVAIGAAAALPWGLWAQLGLTCALGSGVALDWYVVTGGVVPESGRAAANVTLGMGVSIVLAWQTRHHHAQLLSDSFKRREAERALARLNAELEQRVDERTAQLTAATHALEREAHERRQSEAALSAVLENTSDAIWSIDRAGNVAVVNAAARSRFERQFGVPHRSEQGQEREQVLLDEFAALHARAFAGEHVQFERRHTDASGTRFTLNSLHPIVEHGAVIGVTGSSKDITELKRAQDAALQHQADLAHVLRLGTMGEMTAGLAHEINQPLGAIANYAQGCVRRLRDRTIDVESLLPVVEQIAAEALRAGEVIRRLRDLLRKEARREVTADLNHLVRESVRLIEPEARARSVGLQLDLAPTLPTISCNDIQIEQVLLNLLLNGIEAVAIADHELRVVSVHTALAQDAIEVGIRDSGIGLPEPPADVFAPFYTTKVTGLGMGLSISRSIVEAHGGRLWTTRNPTQGATFHFTLPTASSDGI